jgi:hypothetical protein
VARFADALNDETRTMHTEIDVENRHDLLKEGMYAEVKLGLQQNNKESLVVPVQAVVQAGNEHYVLVVDGQDRVQKRSVEVGAQTSTSAEILRGLSEQERVISVGQSDYQVGELVKPKLEKGSANGKDAGGERE